jgi:hypothetical protein
MRWAGHVARFVMIRNTYTILVWNLQTWRPLGRCGRR